MGEIGFDRSDKDNEARQVAANAPLMIALACALLLVALFVAVLEAEGQEVMAPKQVEFGSINGSVTSDTNKPVSGITVFVRRSHAGVANFYFERTTAADGTFRLDYLLPGTYTLQIDPQRTTPDTYGTPF